MTLKEFQRKNYCGPCSLSYALFMLLGREIPQSRLARAASPSDPSRISRKGVAHHEMIRALAKFKVNAMPINALHAQFMNFSKCLAAALKEGYPAILTVKAGRHSHAIALMGLDGKGRFIACDPGRKEVFSVMTRKKIQRLPVPFIVEGRMVRGYSALILTRKDNKPPVFKMSASFKKLVEDESYDDIDAMSEDIKSIADASSRAGKIPFSRHLLRLKPIVMEALEHIDWDIAELGEGDISSFYDDYVIVSEASRLMRSEKVNDATVAAEMTALMTTCAWCGGL